MQIQFLAIVLDKLIILIYFLVQNIEKKSNLSFLKYTPQISLLLPVINLFQEQWDLSWFFRILSQEALFLLPIWIINLSIWSKYSKIYDQPRQLVIPGQTDLVSANLKPSENLTSSCCNHYCCFDNKADRLTAVSVSGFFLQIVLVSLIKLFCFLSPFVWNGKGLRWKDCNRLNKYKKKVTPYRTLLLVRICEYRTPNSKNNTP